MPFGSRVGPSVQIRNARAAVSCESLVVTVVRDGKTAQGIVPDYTTRVPKMP